MKGVWALNVYPYKTIRSGKFTKYQISYTVDGTVLIEYYFKDRRKSFKLLETFKSIKASEYPENVKEAAKWAKYDSKHILGFGGLNT